MFSGQIKKKLVIKLDLQNITGTHTKSFVFLLRTRFRHRNDVIINTGVTSQSTLRGFIGRGTLGGVSLYSRKLGSLVSSHLLVYLL